MARIKRTPAAEQQAQKPVFHCRDCAHSYDWHSPAIDGHLILCRCKFKKEGGKYCIFLKDVQCENFKMRK